MFHKIISGAALVFFAFIGFDVVATASEETRNPKRNVPLGIGVGMALIIVMYVLVAIVTTGMVSYKQLASVESPSLATAFELVGADWAAKIISFGICLGLTTVVMVLLLGLTRVVFAMSRDGLLPRALSTTGKHGTPARLQIVVGVVVAVIAACFNIDVLSDMVNIGTLSAFTLVALAIPIMRKRRPDLKRSFRMPGNPWIPLLVALANFYLMLNLTVLTQSASSYGSWLASSSTLPTGTSMRAWALANLTTRWSNTRSNASSRRSARSRPVPSALWNDASVTKVEAGKD